MADQPVLDFDDIQGNILAGFNKDHQTFLFVRLSDTPAEAQSWLASIIDRSRRTPRFLPSTTSTSSFVPVDNNASTGCCPSSG
jgi:hypothetical protein